MECFEIINGTHPNLEQFDDDFTKGWDSGSKGEATTRLKSITDFGFIYLCWFGFVVFPAAGCRRDVHGLTSGLQGESIDIINAYQRINETVSSLKAVSRDIDNQFHKIYSQAVRHAEKLSVTLSMDRISRRQVNRQNQPAKKPEEYYRITIAITLLETLMAEMETRFGPMSQRAAKLLLLTPSVYCDGELNSSAVKEVSYHRYV